MKKVLLTKSANKAIQLPASQPSVQAAKMVVLPLPNNISPPSESNSTYQQRKIMQPAYRELFRALLRLPDKDVQQRVMDAINGVAPAAATSSSSQICLQCKLQRQRKYASNATQTDDIVANSNKVSAASTAAPFRQKTEQNSNTTTSDDAAEATVSAADVKTTPVKKRRKRKICLPQVIKRSHAQQAQAQSQLLPKFKKRKLDSPDKPKETAPPTALNNIWAKRARSDSVCSSIISAGQLDFLKDDGCMDIFEPPTPTPLQYIHLTMASEYLDSEKFHDGLLPIHYAIINQNRDALRRQIFVWTKMKKLDLNELLTDDDEDCLQLAVVHNCQSEIIKILLDAGLITNGIDAQSNSIVHLALLNHIELDSLALLLKRIDLMLLLQLNDDGHTPLHVAVRHDLYAHAEILLNVLDERLGGAVVYQRNSSGSSNVIPTKEDFLKYYQNKCDHLNKSVYEAIFAQMKLKRRLLDCGEMRSGNTALFVAIENKKEHFIYFLLAHLSDPLISNHGGQNAKSYFGEFSKVLNLSLKIDHAMEKVISAE